MSLAEKMIQEAQKTGATHAKFQTWHEKNLQKGPWDEDGRREIYKKAELSLENFNKLKKICESKKIKFLTSVFNPSDVEPMSKVSSEEIKIPSHEIANSNLIKKCSQNFDKVYLSTGASTESELIEAVKILKDSKKEFVLMHCVSTYPCKDENVNLPRIETLKSMHNRIGFSDHSSDIFSSVLSLQMGVEVIEKHFTIDNSLPGRDNKFAILPAEMKKLSEFIKRFYKINIDHGINYQSCEKDTVEIYRGRWSK